MFNRVLLAVDLGDPSSWARALPITLDLVGHPGASLHIVTVAPDVSPMISNFFPPEAGREVVARVAADLRRFVAEHVPSGMRVQEIVAQGSVHHEIVATADRIGADLIVIAAPRPGVRTYLLGATAAHVTQHSPRSVLIVRG